jgi:hypothetical protein
MAVSAQAPLKVNKVNNITPKMTLFFMEFIILLLGKISKEKGFRSQKNSLEKPLELCYIYTFRKDLPVSPIMTLKNPRRGHFIYA